MERIECYCRVLDLGCFAEIIVVVVDLLLPAALVVACNGLSSPAPSASPASFDVVVGTSPLACSSADLALPVVVAVMRF